MMFPLTFIQTVLHMITVFYAYVIGAVCNDISHLVSCESTEVKMVSSIFCFQNKKGCVVETSKYKDFKITDKYYDERKMRTSKYTSISCAKHKSYHISFGRILYVCKRAARMRVILSEKIYS